VHGRRILLNGVHSSVGFSECHIAGAISGAGAYRFDQRAQIRPKQLSDLVWSVRGRKESPTFWITEQSEKGLSAAWA
jgi:hypothetical protein